MKVCDKCAGPMIETGPSYSFGSHIVNKDFWFRCPRCGRHRIMETVEINMEEIKWQTQGNNMSSILNWI